MTYECSERSLEARTHGVQRTPVLDPTGRMLVRLTPRPLPMRLATLTNTVETAVTPVTLIELVLADANEALEVDTVLTGATSGASGSILAVTRTRNLAGTLRPNVVLMEVASGTFAVNEFLSDGLTFSAKVIGTAPVRPVLLGLHAFNTSASDIILTLRQSHGSVVNKIELSLPAGASKDWNYEWEGKVSDYFTAQLSSAVTDVRISSAWFVERVI